MKIGLDARLYKETGVGRYIKNLTDNLQLTDRENDYVLFILKKDDPDIKLDNPRWKKVIADVKWHTFEEQVKMPYILNRENCGLVHFPYFNVPLLYGRPFIVTVHDLTILSMATGRATTHSKPYYEMKRLGFKIALQHGISKSKKIITVSDTVKNEIKNNFNIRGEKISVTYESGEISPDSGSFPETGFQIDLRGNYLLYVGNAHPHKNIEVLVKAFIIVRETHPELNLVLIGKDDFFYQRLQRELNDREKAGIKFAGNVPDKELASYYQNAGMFIFPSLSEGFGIPGLEAMNYGCPVVCSDIPVFREIYGEAALMFDPKNPKDLAVKISRLLDDKNLKQEYIEKGRRQAEKYSWKKMADETLAIYKSLAY